jgi:hypothetical protein
MDFIMPFSSFFSSNVRLGGRRSEVGGQESGVRKQGSGKLQSNQKLKINIRHSEINSILSTFAAFAIFAVNHTIKNPAFHPLNLPVIIR